MIDVELTRDALPVHIVNVDQLWALKSRLEVSLSHVVGDEADHLVLMRGWWKGLRAPGAFVSRNHRGRRLLSGGRARVL